MLNITFCDDDKALSDTIQSKIHLALNAKGIPHTIISFQDPVAFWSDIKNNAMHYNVFIVDLELPGLTGQELVMRIKEKVLKPYIILLTCHTEYVYDGYELEVFRFISKENYEQRLFSALYEIEDRLNKQQEQNYICKYQGVNFRIAYKDILYITKDGKYSVLHTQTHSPMFLRISLDGIWKELNSPEQFFFINRGCIINVDHIMSLKNKGSCHVQLDNGEIFSITHSKVGALAEAVNHKWGIEL